MSFLSFVFHSISLHPSKHHRVSNLVLWFPSIESVLTLVPLNPFCKRTIWSNGFVDPPYRYNVLHFRKPSLTLRYSSIRGTFLSTRLRDWLHVFQGDLRRLFPFIVAIGCGYDSCCLLLSFPLTLYHIFGQPRVECQVLINNLF